MKLISQYFERLWKDAKKKRKRQILSLLKLKNHSVLLDCGCDTGIYSVRLGKKLSAKKIYGIEINKNSAKEARKRGVNVKISDLNKKFPFKKESFDVVVADQVIEHLWDLDNFVTEIKRVLKKNGYAIISTENLASWHNVGSLVLGLQPFTGPTVSSKKVIGFHPLVPSVEKMKDKYKHTYEMPSHTKVLTLTALASLFDSYGFKVEKKICSGYLPFSGFISNLLEKIDKRHSLFITIKAEKK